MWPFSKNIKETVEIIPEEDKFYNQIVNHVREVNKYRILMDKSWDEAGVFLDAKTYECKEYACLMRKRNKAMDDKERYTKLWTFHTDILRLMIVIGIIIIVDVDGIKYKVSNKVGGLGSYIDIEEVV